MATHSSIPAWEIQWIEEPGRLQSMGVTKESDMTEQISTHTHTHTGTRAHARTHTQWTVADIDKSWLQHGHQ